MAPNKKAEAKLEAAAERSVATSVPHCFFAGKKSLLLFLDNVPGVETPGLEQLLYEKLCNKLIALRLISLSGLLHLHDREYHLF